MRIFKNKRVISESVADRCIIVYIEFELSTKASSRSRKWLVLVTFIQSSSKILLEVAFVLFAHCYKDSPSNFNNGTLSLERCRIYCNFPTACELEVTSNKERDTGGELFRNHENGNSSLLSRLLVERLAALSCPLSAWLTWMARPSSCAVSVKSE